MKLITFIIVLGFILIGTSCDRSGGSLTQLKLSVPVKQKAKNNKLGALAFNPLVHLIVVLREKSVLEVDRITWDADCDQSAGTCSPPPLYHTFFVNRSIPYLIQVLAVYQDSTESLTFMYGDTVKVPQGSIDQADINVAAVGTSSSKEFRIGGRFLTAANTGPTGEIVMSYQPPGDTPAVPILSELMVNGWFQLFTLTGAPINYSLKGTHEKLFAALDFSATTSTGVNETPYRMRLSFPDSYRYDQGDNSYRMERGGEILMGYFGPYVDANPTDFKLCYETLNNTNYSDLFLDNSGATALTFDSVPPLDQNSVHPSTGAGGDGNASCSSGSETHKMTFNYQQFDGWAGSLFGFEPPYLHQDTGNGYYSVFKTIAATSASGQTNVTIGWKYLPDVFNQGISGSHVFLVDRNQLDLYEKDHDIDCQSLSYDAQAFTSVANIGNVTSFATTVDDSTGGQVDIQIPDAWLQNDQGEMVICPFLLVGGTPDYPFLGKKSHGLYFDVPTSILNAKIVGSGSYAENSLYYSNQGIGEQAYSFLNMNITGSFNPIYLVPFADDINPNGFGHRLINFSDVASAEISFDAGGTWIEILSNCAGAMENFSSNQGSIFRMQLAGLSTCSAIAAPWGNGSTDVTIQVRVGLTSTASSNYGLGGGGSSTGPVYTTGQLTLVGDSSCSSPTPAMVKTATPSGIVAPTNFMDEFFASNGTDLETEYQLAFQSSATVCIDSSNGGRNLSVIINSFSYAGPNCFNNNDFILGGKSHPFSFLVSPQDRTAADCNLDFAPQDFNLAGENAIYYRATHSGSDTIAHSTVGSRLNSYLSVEASPTNIGDRRFVIHQVLMSKGLKIGTFNAKANTDYQAIDVSTAAGVPTNTTWDVNALLANTGLHSNPHILETALTPAPPLNTTIDYSDSGMTGQFDLALQDTLEDVIWVAKKNFRDGSPLILTKDLTNNNWVYYIPNNETKLQWVYGPFTGSVGHGGVDHYRDPTDGKDILVYSMGDKLNYVALDYDGQALATDVQVLNSPKQVFDFKVTKDSSSTEFILATTEEGFNDGRIFYLALSSYNKGTDVWSHPAPASNLIVNETGFLLDCGGFQFLHGIWNANFSAIIPYSIGNGAITGTSPTNHSLGNATGDYFGEYNRFDCTVNNGEQHFIAYKSHALATGPSTGRIPKVFKVYNEGTNASFNQDILTNASEHIDAMEFIDLGGAFDDLLVVARPMTLSSPIRLDIYTVQTGASTYSFSKTIGSLPNGAAKQINGFRKTMNPGNKDKYYLYGNLGQIYVLELK